ncbi:MAG: GNAT family N-acyltransferase, partial [Pseudomonadota bacterium]
MTTELKSTSVEKTDDPTLPSPEIAGRIGGLQTRLAGNHDEVRAAQHIRFQVFRKSTERDASGLDADDYDATFDHLLVLDDAATDNLGIVATQRLQTRMAESGAQGLYSSSQFDLEELMCRHSGKCFMELGRSCILPAYRGKRTMELLWHGTWDYARKRSVDVMFGCASFTTTDPETIVDELS